MDYVLKRILKARGAAVPGLGFREGKRRDAGLVSLPRGGKRVKTNFMKKWRHPDVLEALEKKMSIVESQIIN